MTHRVRGARAPGKSASRRNTHPGEIAPSTNPFEFQLAVDEIRESVQLTVIESLNRWTEEMNTMLDRMREEWRQQPLISRVLSPPIWTFVIVAFATHVAGYWGR